MIVIEGGGTGVIYRDYKEPLMISFKTVRAGGYQSYLLFVDLSTSTSTREPIPLRGRQRRDKGEARRLISDL